MEECQSQREVRNPKDSREKCNMLVLKMGEEPQAEECLQPPGAGEGKGEDPSGASRRGHSPASALNLASDTWARPLTSRTVS